MKNKELDIKKELTPIQRWVENLKVENLEQYKNCISRIQEISSLRNRWIEYWNPIKTKAFATWKEIVAREYVNNLKVGLSEIDRIISKAKEIALKWKLEDEKHAQEIQDRLQFRNQDEGFKVLAVSESDLVSDASIRKTWKGKVVDMNALIKAAKQGNPAFSFLIVNQKELDKFARKTKGNVSVPGVEFFEETSLTVKEKTEKGDE